MDKIEYKNKYNKDYCSFYDELNFDALIDRFNQKVIKENESEAMEYNEFSIEGIISKIDCTLFNGESFENQGLYEEFQEFIQSPIFNFIYGDPENEETSKLIDKIGYDISNEKISGDVADILDFYFEQYNSIKKQFLLNNFLNNYLQSDDYWELLSRYGSYTDVMIFNIISNVKHDISVDESMDEDKVILKLEYYFKAETNKNEYRIKIR